METVARSTGTFSFSPNSGYYTNELRHRGYGKSLCYLPHDGVNGMR